jgi:uncharacterized protein YjbJ (UPF0337 family)
MDKNRIIGSAKQVKGSIMQTVGKALGDTKLQVEGKTEEMEGKAQNLAGSISDTVKEATKS